jgi:phage terminase large subunit-like protein
MLLSEKFGLEGMNNEPLQWVQPPKSPPVKPGTPPLPDQDPGFVDFCRWCSYPSYKGLYKWQEECYSELSEHKYQCIIVHRDGGKSIYLGNVCEYDIQYRGYDVLYLGWTDRRKEVAQNIANFFEKYDQMADKKSNYHFRTKNGGKFDCYLITGKEVLGMHSFGKEARFENLTPEEIAQYKKLFEGNEVFSEESLLKFISERNTARKLVIVIDDPIDDTFMKERFREEDLERRFMSTIYNINPDEWIFTGTRKFDEDFFYFIKKTFGKKLKEYNRGPYLRQGEARYNADLVNNPMNIVCPERFTHPSMPSYTVDISPVEVNPDGTAKLDKKGNKINKIVKRDLQEIYDVLLNSGKLYWWFAEYWNDPHPITGEVWTTIQEKLIMDTPAERKHDLLWITIDRATTTNETSSYTGCVIGVRELATGDRIIIDDFTDLIPFYELLIKINDFLIQWRLMYRRMQCVIIIEQQGGGSDFVSMAKSLREFIKPDGTRVKNKIPEIAVIIEVHNTGEKYSRIKERLYAPIKNGKIKILHAAKSSEVVKEILNYPHSSKVDAIDALANVDFVIMEHYPYRDGKTFAQELIDLFDQAEVLEREREKEEQQMANEAKGLDARGKRTVFPQF